MWVKATASASKHGDDSFRNHRHVNRDSVSDFEAKLAKTGGELFDLGMKFSVTPTHDFTGLTLPNDRRLFSTSGSNAYQGNWSKR